VINKTIKNTYRKLSKHTMLHVQESTCILMSLTNQDFLVLVLVVKRETNVDPTNTINNNKDLRSIDQRTAIKYRIHIMYM
jgi:hypothetical protein